MKRLDVFKSDDGRFTSTEEEVGLYEKSDIGFNIKFVKHNNKTQLSDGTYILVLNSGEIVVDILNEGIWKNTLDNDIIMCSLNRLPSRLAYIK